jgi:integrase
MPKKAKELSAIAVSKLKSKGRHAVGGVDGLLLNIAGNSKSWILRVAVGTRTDGKGKTVIHRRDIGLGGFPDVPLSEARERARELRKMIRDGIDPLEYKKHHRKILFTSQVKSRTFRECAEVVIENKKRELKSINYQKLWRKCFEIHVFPHIGDRAIAGITRTDVVAVLEPIWRAKYRTAKEIRGRIEAVLNYAKAMDYREGENPAAWKGVLEPILGKVRHVVRPRPSLPYAAIGAFMAELRKREGIHARALEFAILTAARAGEVFGATWEEIDLAAKIWIIPAERMKAEKEHRVPLSDGAAGLLESLPVKGSHVFQSMLGKRIAHTTVSRIIREMHEADLQAGGRGFIDPKLNSVATMHGFRATFRDWAAEATAYPREVCEHALAHRLLDKVEAAYQRGDLLVKRAALMSDWARYCGAG